MKVRLKLFATLREYLPEGVGAEGVELELPEGATVQDALDELSVPLEKKAIILRNGVHAKPESELDPGDELSVFPAIGGG